MKNKEKGQDVVKAFYKAMSYNPNKSIFELFQIACKTPALQFYVSLSNAKRLVSMLDRSLELPLTSENKKRMYSELYSRLKKKRGDKKKCYQLLEEIINSPASEFYMDAETFKQIFYKTIRNKRKKL